jgi:hypothetical protein
MDVCQDEVPHVAEREAMPLEARGQGLDARRRPTIDERRLVAREQVRRNDPRPSQVEQIEELEAAI